MTPRYLSISIVALHCLLPSYAQAPLQNPLEIAIKFLPPSTKLAETYKLDAKTRSATEREPAVLAGHFLSARSEDIAFAYYTPASSPDHEKCFFVALLHKSSSGYVKLWEQSFYSEGFITPQAMRLIKVSREHPDLLAVVTGLGASVGGRLRVFRWDATWGFTNVAPENQGGHQFDFSQSEKGPRVTVSFEKYPGDTGARPPVTYSWDGKKLLETHLPGNRAECPTCPH